MEVKLIKHHSPWLTLLWSLLLLAAGLLVLFMSGEIAEFLLLTFVIVYLFVIGIVRLVQCIKEKHILRGVIWLTSSWILVALLLFLDYKLDDVAILPSLAVSVISLLLAIVRLLICIHCAKYHLKGAVRNGFETALCLAVGLLLVIHPIQNFDLLTFICGIYFIIYAITMLCDFFASIFHLDLSDKRQRRRIHFAKPNIITALTPSRIISYINKGLSKGDFERGMVIEEEKNACYDSANVEIFIHLTTQGANKFGHVDLAIGDTVYSYGSYDISKNKLMGFVSQGTMIMVPKIPYLKYCLDNQKKYVIGFGVHLSKLQIDNIKQRIKTIVSWGEPFESVYEQKLKEQKSGKEFDDPASNIVRDLGGKVWVINKGPFKRYFGININCVRVADWLLSDTGLDAISFSGIRTPGAYYAMLMGMLRRKNTRVFRRTAYILSKDIFEPEDLKKKYPNAVKRSEEKKAKPIFKKKKKKKSSAKTAKQPVNQHRKKKKKARK